MDQDRTKEVDEALQHAGEAEQAAELSSDDLKAAAGGNDLSFGELEVLSSGVYGCPNMDNEGEPFELLHPDIDPRDIFLANDREDAELEEIVRFMKSQSGRG